MREEWTEISISWVLPVLHKMELVFTVVAWRWLPQPGLPLAGSLPLGLATLPPYSLPHSWAHGMSRLRFTTPEKSTSSFHLSLSAQLSGNWRSDTKWECKRASDLGLTFSIPLQEISPVEASSNGWVDGFCPSVLEVDMYLFAKLCEVGMIPEHMGSEFAKFAIIFFYVLSFPTF